MENGRVERLTTACCHMLELLWIISNSITGLICKHSFLSRRSVDGHVSTSFIDSVAIYYILRRSKPSVSMRLAVLKLFYFFRLLAVKLTDLLIKVLRYNVLIVIVLYSVLVLTSSMLMTGTDA